MTGTRTRRVVVTGLGAISALGVGVDRLWSGVQAGVCGIRAIEGIPLDRLTVRLAGQVPAFEGSEHFDVRKLAFLDRTAQFALVAAREAMATAAPDLPEPRRGGVIFGASIGHETTDAAYKTFYADNSNRLHPFTVPRIMPSSPASHLSMEFGLRGSCYSTASACASSAHAIGLAAQAVATGQLDLAVTGGSDAPLCVGVFKCWEALRVLSTGVCRPFSRDRTGLTLGEGAGVLVLEPLERAQARGATIYGEIIGFGMSADAADITSPAVQGAADAMLSALDSAGIAPSAVDYINAHGTGTRLNDRTEVAAIRAVFGSHADRLAASSTKSMLGHALCAGGALELIVSLLALRHGVLPPTVNHREADPDCAIDCVPNQSRRASIEVALCNSFAFGGLNAVIAARRWPD